MLQTSGQYQKARIITGQTKSDKMTTFISLLQNSDGEWVQSLSYTPDQYDDGKSLSCSVQQATAAEEAEDSVKLVMVLFKPAEGLKNKNIY